MNHGHKNYVVGETVLNDRNSHSHRLKQNLERNSIAFVFIETFIQKLKTLHCFECFAKPVATIELGATCSNKKSSEVREMNEHVFLRMILEKYVSLLIDVGSSLSYISPLIVESCK